MLYNVVLPLSLKNVNSETLSLIKLYDISIQACRITLTTGTQLVTFTVVPHSLTQDGFEQCGPKTHVALELLGVHLSRQKMFH